jgi:gamma-butyrobetaine dioxygenase
LEFAERKVHPDGKLEITWRNDIPGYSDNHISTYSKEFLDRFSRAPGSDISSLKEQPQIFWDREKITEKVKFLNFDEYMSSDAVLYDALVQLRACGLLFIQGVPDSATAVEDIGGRIGDLKHTFYGRTWDVKSIPQAENIAYTNKVLGLHMDLLYLFHPPSLQLLHCLRNSCEGGNSLFSDSFFAAYKLRDQDPKKFEILTKEELTFSYENVGRSYEQHRPAIQLWSAKKPTVKCVNWSPPFQGPFKLGHGISDRESLRRFAAHFEALKSFASHIEDLENVYEYRLKEGECVIFDNRRVLHARRAFDTSSGERWLKGAYLDLEVWWQRYTKLHEGLKWLHI